MPKWTFFRICIGEIFQGFFGVSKLLSLPQFHVLFQDPCNQERRFDKRRNFVCFVKVLDDTPIDQCNYEAQKCFFNFNFEFTALFLAYFSWTFFKNDKQDNFGQIHCNLPLGNPNLLHLIFKFFSGDVRQIDFS